MKNYRAVIRDTLKSVQSDIPYDIKMAFPESKPAGNLITFYEITNTGTELACVDVIAYQVDLWFMTLPDLLELTEKVDEALTSLGLIRQFASSDALLHDPSGYLRKSLRYHWVNASGASFRKSGKTVQRLSILHTVSARQERTARTPSAPRGCGAESAKPHELVDDPVTHLDRADQHQHVENEFTHIVPHDGGCCQRIVRNGRR